MESFRDVCEEALDDLYGWAFVEMDAEFEAMMERARQARIAAGEEHACAVCGCSETKACAGGCVWATERLCSRCA